MNALTEQLWTAIRPTNRRQLFLGRCGTLLLASGLLHAVVAALDGSSWWGAVSWRKPTVFGLSGGVFLWSMVWVLRQLPERPRRERLLVGFLGPPMVIEVALITVQRWRGVPSHFNITTIPDRVIFDIMGLGFIFVALAVFGLAAWSLVEFRGDAASRVTVVAGLSGMVAAGVIGGRMLKVGMTEVKATGQVPDSVMFGVAGSAKLAHAIGLHGFDVLALLCIGLALGPLRAQTRLRLMALASAGFVAVFVAVTSTAWTGRAWTHPTAPMALLGLLGLAALATVAAVAGFTLGQARHHGGPGHGAPRHRGHGHRGHGHRGHGHRGHGHGGHGHGGQGHGAPRRSPRRRAAHHRRSQRVHGAPS